MWLSFTTLSFLFLLLSPAARAGVAEGQELFQSQCARCHKPYANATGPALFGVVDRFADGDTALLKEWIVNSQAVLASSGDPYVQDLWDTWGPSIMPAFPQFSDQDIRDIIAFMQSWEPEPQDVATGPAGEARPAIDPAVLIVIVIVLAFVALLLGRVTFFLRQRVRELNDEPVPEPVPLMQRPGVKPLVAIAGIVLVCFLGYSTYDGAAALGRQENYMPDQPIAFSHELHAGVNQINCRYCHVGAEKGKAAVIPSLNVCMNCHFDVKEGRTAEGTAEIAKIYSHIGFNPENAKYEGEQEPVEWVRIHNLPDHVYFNHAQHVVVGQIDCQTCHGPVEEMEVMYQFENLSMGWCVNCHRRTEVQFTSNDFYGEYEELHEKLATGELDAIHVEDVGGTECQRCHY